MTVNTWLTEQRKEREKEVSNIPYAKQRYSICKSCDRLNDILVCSECYCFMPGKVLLKNVECPINKWGSEIES